MAFCVFTNVIVNAQIVNRSKTREVVYSTRLSRFSTRDEAAMPQSSKSTFVKSLNGDWKLSLANESNVSEATVKIPGVWYENFADHTQRLLFKDKSSLVQMYKNSPIGVIERQFEMTQAWLDRETFIEIDNPGAVAITLIVNGEEVGYVDDSKEFVKFDITGFVREGANTVQIVMRRYSVGTFLSSERYVDQKVAEIGDVRLVSAPRYRIEDFELLARYDSTGKNGLFELKIIVANGRNFAETGIVYYDLMDEKGDIIRYNYRELTVDGLGRDTLVFEGRIDKVKKWSSRTPSTYRLMMRVKRGADFTEYIPFDFGFRTLAYQDGQVVLNGTPISIKTLDYNRNCVSNKELSQYISKVQKQGYNTLLLMTPQSQEFYDVCTKKGMYVIDAVDISPVIEDSIKNIANDPELLKFFEQRVKETYLRNRNNSCVIGWSLGNAKYNGYNYKKAYLYFKELDSTRPIIFRGAVNWNNDKLN